MLSLSSLSPPHSLSLLRNALPGLIQLRSKRRCGSNERLINEICASCSIPLSSTTIPDKNMCLFRKYLEILFNELLPLPGGYIRMESPRISPPDIGYLLLSTSARHFFRLLFVFVRRMWIFNSQIKFLWTWIDKWRLNIEICFVFKYYNEYFGHFACHFVGLYICCICRLIIIICYYWLTSLIIYGNIEYSSNFGVFKKIIGIFFYF